MHRRLLPWCSWPRRSGEETFGSMSSARLLHAVPKRLMEQARLELWLSNWHRSLPLSGKSLNESWEARMSEQERESPLPSQRGDQHNQLIPGGRIEANMITGTNV